ncbi:hypothetical protein B7P43_G13602 [Cryptotermes secundus]|uniref:Uncharacterized protein n=1 Tax=Cryptotermes secundus TaxID=105785 RepID=A0A2J7Q6T4_9NEOP|nr:hypothetical protein B7P43_G13602 [Cryptotermes secundus]
MQQLQPQHKAMLLTNRDTHLKSGLIQTADLRKFKQPSPPIIIADIKQPFGFTSENGDQKTINELKENIPKTSSGLHTEPNFNFAAPPHSSVHHKQKSTVIKKEVSTSGSQSLGEGLQNNQQQQNKNSINSISGENIQQNGVRIGDQNYVWRDVSPGLEISSNAPQLVAGSQHNLAAARQPRTHDDIKKEQESTTSEHSNVRGQTDVVTNYVTGTNLKVGKVSNFDHANALGHSANFGYTDALVSLPVQLQTSGAQAKGHEAGLEEQGTQYKNTGRKIPNSLTDSGKSAENIGTVFLGNNGSPGAVGPAVNNLANQHSQHHHSQTNSLLPQANFAVDPKGHKVLLKPNKGLIQAIPGSLILGNKFHAGYDSRNIGTQNKILSTQGMVNTIGHGVPLQVFYLPVSGPHIDQLGNHPIQIATVDQVQQSTPAFDGLHVGQGINTATMPYIGVMNRGLYGYSGFGGLPILQGNFLGIQGMHGAAGGATLHHVGSILLGSNHLSLPSDVPAPDNNPTQEAYKPAFQSGLQAIGQRHHNAVQTYGNQHTPLTAGQEALSFQNAVPYQHQQVNKQQTLAPQVSVHPNGLGLRLLQQHPVPHKNIKFGGYQSLPFGGHQYLQQQSGLPAHDHVAGIPNRGYRTFSFSPRIHQPMNQQHTFKFKPLLATPDTHVSSHKHQAVVTRNARVSKPTALPMPERPWGDKSAEGRLKWYLGSKPPKTTGPFSSNSHYAIGMKPRNAGPGLIRK